MAKKLTYEELEQRVKELEKVVDEHSRKEKVIQAWGQEKETILNSLIEHVIHQDTEMRILWANQAARHSVNLQHEELIGRYCYEVWPQGSEPCPDCPVKKAMETRQPQEVEKSTPDGKFWLIRGYPEIDENGDVVGGIEVTLELTTQKQTEEVLRESEERYRNLVENSLNAIILYRQDYIIFANEQFFNIFGYKREELQNLVIDDILAPEVVDEVAALRCRRLAGEIEQATVYESKGKRKSGEIFHMEISVCVVSYQGESCLMAFLSDVSKRKQADEALHESQERYRSLFERSLDCIYIHDFEGNIIDANSAALDLLGYSKEDISSLNLASLRSEDKIPIAFQALEEIKKTGSQRDVTEFKLKRKNGEHVIVESTGSLLYHEGEPYAILGIARDITERKLAQEALMESEEQLRSILDVAPNAITITSLADDRYLLVNTYFTQKCGYTPEEVLGKSSFGLGLYVDPEDFKNLIKILQEKGGVNSFELKYRVKDGSIFDALISIRTIRFGGEDALIAVTTDITEQKQVEEALRESERKFRSLFDLSPQAISLTDMETGRLIDVNDKYVELSKYTKEELLGHTTTELGFYCLTDKATSCGRGQS